MKGGRSVQPRYARFQQPVRHTPFHMRRIPLNSPRQFGIEQTPFRGGFLSRLFGRQPPPSVQPPNPFHFGSRTVASASSNSWQSLLNPEKITHFLGQTQQVLRTGQQMISLYQQYGPLIRNLPALWKMYRSLSSSDEDTEEENESEDTPLDAFDEEDEVEEEGEEDEQLDLDDSVNDIDPTDSEKQIESNEKKLNNPKPAQKKKSPRKKQAAYIYKESVPKLYI